MTEERSPEVAVRRYLAWLADPTSLIDQEAVDKAEAAFEKAADPIDRLHAAAALERARSADEAAITRDFIAQAKAYGDAEGIPAAAFAKLGVDADVLAQAGFEVEGRRGRTRRAAKSSSSRSPQVSVSQIKAQAVQMPKQFTLVQLADKAGGGSPATVRKAVEELISEGRVANVGPDANHKGPGRAPTLYELR